jgi:hypothetical protein
VADRALNAQHDLRGVAQIAQGHGAHGSEMGAGPAGRIFISKNWGGLTSWSDETISPIANDPAGSSSSAGSFSWSSLGMDRKSLARDATGAYEVIFAPRSTLANRCCDRREGGPIGDCCLKWGPLVRSAAWAAG